ncbi:HIT family protein [Acaryochloris sp. IP29b_bin.148]|uniref:HIT family protein n=1 Tax=Acaryochloris sp. IP29b_bin.148 TaxID=2969218 RepID=UPI00261299DA|nr:HIT family protein [Acaryochloris sp. IP29b_bin.148]
MKTCPFCAITRGEAPVSTVFEDKEVMAFIPLHPVYPGACLVIPKIHIDHFTDLPDPLAARVMVIAQQVGRKIMEVYNPLRVGLLVHGFTVPHAHLHVIPQYGPLDIMHKHYAYCADGKVQFGDKDIPTLSRPELDRLAADIRL